MHGVGEHVYNESPTRYQRSRAKSVDSTQHVGLTCRFRFQQMLDSERLDFAALSPRTSLPWGFPPLCALRGIQSWRPLDGITFQYLACLVSYTRARNEIANVQAKATYVHLSCCQGFCSGMICSNSDRSLLEIPHQCIGASQNIGRLSMLRVF